MGLQIYVITLQNVWHRKSSISDISLMLLKSQKKWYSLSLPSNLLSNSPQLTTYTSFIFSIFLSPKLLFVIILNKVLVLLIAISIFCSKDFSNLVVLCVILIPYTLFIFFVHFSLCSLFSLS